jgi:hypothetical protein
VDGRDIDDGQLLHMHNNNWDMIVGDFGIHVLTPYEKVWPVTSKSP